MRGTSEVVLILLVLFIACGIHVALARLAPRLRLIKNNFLNKQVLGSYGVISFADTAGLVCIGCIAGIIRCADAAIYLCVMGAMCALGLADDLLGSRDVGGFRGHFRMLILQRRLTTGTLKAAGGALVGAAAARVVSGGDLARWIAGTLVIALAANFLNLVDLRPGRAVAVFFAGLGVTCVMAYGRLHSPWIIGAICLVAFAWGIADSRGRAMMGDAGSNSLGAALGLTITLNLGLGGQIGAIVILAAINWYSEKHSISALIERHPVLRAIDGRLGVR
ncbi:MAG: hypothetical protein ACP5R5_08380 [Armatimonadota bacterium]